MDIVRLCQLLWRRKLVVGPMTLLVLCGLVYSYTAAPKIYRSSGSVVLLSPKIPDVGPGVTLPAPQRNPYVQFSDPSTVLDLVSRRMSSPAIGEEMRKRGLVGKVTVGGNLQFYHGPILDISADSPSALTAVSDVRIAMDEAGRQLAEIQSQQGTAPAFSITTASVVPPNGASRVLSSTVRRLLATATIGLLLILMSAVAAEGVVTRLRSRRAAGHALDPGKKLIIQPAAMVQWPADEPAAAAGSGGAREASIGPTGPNRGGLRLTSRGRGA